MGIRALTTRVVGIGVGATGAAIGVDAISDSIDWQNILGDNNFLPDVSAENIAEAEKTLDAQQAAAAAGATTAVGAGVGNSVGRAAGKSWEQRVEERKAVEAVREGRT